MASKKYLLILFLFASVSIQGQVEDKKERLSFFEIIDSLFIDHDLKNYSARVFSNYKVKKFRLSNTDYTARYIPNNRFGLGFGFASSKILVDIAFNVKSGKKEATNRFDAQGSIVLRGHHYFSGYIQIYRGYNIKNDFDEPNVFRTDIKSKNIGFNYLYTLSEVEFSYSLLKAGLIKSDKKVYLNGGIGTFAVFDLFTASNTILPENGDLYFNEQANIEYYNGRAVGILAGFLSAFILPQNLIATCNIMPGIALMNKSLIAQDMSYKPSKPMLYKMDIALALSYNVERYYVNLTYGTGIYSTDLDFDNRYVFTQSMAKLAFGYKLKI